MLLVRIDPGPSTLTMEERDAAMRTVAAEFRFGWRSAVGAFVVLVSTVSMSVRFPWGWAS